MSILITFLLSLTFLPTGLFGSVDTTNIPDAVRNRGGVPTATDQVRFNTNQIPDALRARVTIDRRH